MSFDDLLAQAEAQFDKVFGQAFEYHPRAAADPNRRSGPDPTRPVTAFTGIPSDTSARAGYGNGPSMFDTQNHHATSRPMVSVLASALPFRPAKGDRIVEPESETTWVVSEVRPEGDGRVVLDLNLLARP